MVGRRQQPEQGHRDRARGYSRPDRPPPQHGGARRQGVLRPQDAPRDHRSHQVHRPRLGHRRAAANLWEVKQVVGGEAVYDNNGTMTDIWGKQVVVAYTELSGLADMGTPSYGYTYRLGGYPIVEQPYQDRSAKSWIYPVTDELAPVIAGAAGGYLISAAVA